MKIANHSVLITGGASGIGKIMGRLALEKGARCLIIWDINEQSIETVKAEHSRLGKVYGYKVDVSDVEAVKAAYAKTVEDCGQVDILINNAGIVTSNRLFVDNTYEEIERTLRINSAAPMYVALTVLKDMVSRDSGHICNIASAAGMLAVPRMSAYVASKWANVGWSESVRIELQDSGSKVQFTTVTPYFINTGMFDGVESKIFPILKPEKTSKKIIKAIEKGKETKGIPFPFHFIRMCEFIFPMRIFDWFFGEVFGIYHVMDHFTGRKK